ncbi:antibiotic biosynthesis monooxygenase [Listeria sp. PSOL-1]|uniref:antibiotic biosynthesis monooxygenase n=1 Tax=Listeria sp. PSOL-1 TaxID=1844999 RepID=UPI0013D66B21|nr:antibiotic biosynthesis monooxygenase [Listeria sp. PSOL-1]
MKNIYITTGTEHFLRQILNDHPSDNILLLQNYNQSLLLQESSDPTVFKEESTYHLLQNRGEIKGSGSVVFEYIMVRDEEIPLFLKLYQNLSVHFNETAGLQCIQLGQSLKNNKFIIIMFWDNASDYPLWKKTPHYQEIVKVMESNNTQIGFSHTDIYHFPEFTHDAK